MMGDGERCLGKLRNPQGREGLGQGKMLCGVGHPVSHASILSPTFVQFLSKLHSRASNNKARLTSALFYSYKHHPTTIHNMPCLATPRHPKKAAHHVVIHAIIPLLELTFEGGSDELA
jgi:hypothetical protein